MSCLVEIPQLVLWKLLFSLQTLAFHMRNVMRCHGCRNEVTIDRYHTWNKYIHMYLITTSPVVQ